MSEWINIKDKHAPENLWVLVGGGDIGSVDYGCRIGEKYYMFGEMDKKITWATHWMLLPEPPK